MKRALWLLPLALLVLTASGCSSLYVHTDYDRAADFRGYRSYAWAPTRANEEGKTGRYDLLDKRIRRAVDQELAAKGFAARNRPADADVLVVYRLHTQERVRVYSGYHSPWRRSAYRYQEGALVLQIVDLASESVVWEGVGEGILEYHRSDSQEKVAEAVAKILAEFPPEAEA